MRRGEEARTMEPDRGDALFQSCVDGARERLRRARERAAAWNVEAASQAWAAARRLRSEFGAREVILFGSVARGEGRPGSDVDLLVDGVPDERWFDACAAAADEVRCAEVDMVPRRHARPHVLQRALAEGRALDG